MKRIVLLLFLLLSLNACQDFFDLDRPPQNPWQTVEDFERAPIGAYGILFADREWVQAWPNYAVVNTSMGDDVAYVNDDQWGYLRRTEEGTDLSERNWWLLYRGIGAANAALDFVKEKNGVPFPEASVTESKNSIERIVGELHFIRGFCYYLLATTFGNAYVPGGPNNGKDIPLRVSFARSAKDATAPKIGTTQELWDLILDDFKKARQMLPTDFNPALHHPSFQIRANQFAAAGMLMRTYLQRGEYALAKQECDFIIDQNNGAYNLSEDPIQAFNKSGYAERGKEVIWYLPYSDQTLYPPSHLSVLNATWNGKKCRWNETRMSSKTLNRLGWIDNPATQTEFNVSALRDKRFQQLMTVRYPKSKASPIQDTDDRPEIAEKTSVWPFKYYRGPNADYTNVPMLRLAEVYLTRAIIRFNSGDKAGAADDLNRVRSRAWDEKIGGPYIAVNAASITAEMIHDERVIEMFNEADRINYLRALKVNIPEGERGSGSDPYTSKKFVWAIPESELLYNDGYR